eukprot:TRINITY_DN4585_c0_g4_i1.p1 TRINITY_DN4585_c0_g4~~TRINITY_DN4585_c0_g4_i1.p1  ORF type:complete len:572 (+),score=112.42 TRINITY_DN4585_c0_g4_i1:2-1717(+)
MKLIKIIQGIIFLSFLNSILGCSVLLVVSDASSKVIDVRNKILSTGLFSTVNFFFANESSALLSDLQPYDAILVYTNVNPADMSITGDSVASYIDNGGGVVNAIFSLAGPGTNFMLGGTFASFPDKYQVLFQTQSLVFDARTMGTVYPTTLTSTLMNGVNSFDGGTYSYRATSSLQLNAIRVADWSDGTPLVIASSTSGSSGTRRRVDLNFYPPSTDGAGFWNPSTDGALMMANALSWVGGCTNPPTTLTPSTLTPSTTEPSTLAPSTTEPSTLTPSTLNPSTTEPSTLPPSTFTPSTTSPSTNSPSTLTPSTLPPSTTGFSTLSPSTSVSSTTSPSTLTPSTALLTTIIPSSNCLYEVLNCDKCGSQGIIVNQTLFNISCINDGSKWVYSFSDKFSDTFTVKESITLNQTSIIIQGNFNQTADTTIIVVISPQNKNSALNVTGCVSLNGNISLVLDEKPQSGIVNVSLISYNCTQKVNVTNNQFSVTPTYKNNQCDKVGSSINNQQNSLSVSISSSVNANCNGISTGVIIAIVLSIVGSSVLVVAFISFIMYRRRTLMEKQISIVGTEMN